MHFLQQSGCQWVPVLVALMNPVSLPWRNRAFNDGSRLNCRETKSLMPL